MNNQELVTIQLQCRPEIAEKLVAIIELENNPQLTATPEQLEALEKTLLKQTHELCGQIVEKQIQQAIDSEEVHQTQRQILQAMPYKMKDKGKETVRVRTCFGFEVSVRISYFTRKGNRRGKRRYPGLYPGLMVLGIHERCTPGLAAEISLLAGMLGSLEEAREVLAERGIELNIKVVRRITYRFAQRVYCPP